MSESVPSLSPEEELAEQFYRWELRGRGWGTWDAPVAIEPPFRPFFGHWIAERSFADDGRKPTLVSGVLGWLHRKFAGAGNTLALPSIESSDEEPEPKEWNDPDEWVELRVALPRDADIGKAAAEQFLLGLSGCRRTIAFELIGLPDAILIQIACDSRDADSVEGQLAAFFPEAVISRDGDGLADAWEAADCGETVVAEFGLSREFMLPLATPTNFSTDPLVGLTGALSGVRDGEIALVQILFQPVSHPWAESILRSVVFCDGTPFFCGLRDFVGHAKQKISRPLYGVVIRAACRSGQEGRAWELAKGLAGTLKILADPDGNELIPLANDDYDEDDHAADVPLRRCRRSGVILNSDELVSLVHLPSSSVRSTKLRQSLRRSCAAPPQVLNHKLVLGVNEHGGVSKRVTLSADQRAKHLHAVGASGTGKSTLLLNLIGQDIQNGDGVAVFDPHGDLIDAVLDRIPAHRINDVVLLDPADEAYPVGFNILSAHSDLEKNLLASDLVAVFRRLSTSWGDQMTSVLGNAILAFVESTRGGTLADLRRFLVEPPYRKEFLTTITDPEVAYYWAKEFPLLTGRPQGPVLTRLDTFLRPKPIRYMVAQKQSRLDFANIMDGGKIFLARLSHGVIGEENSYLLGSLLVSKFHQLALGRQQQKELDRRHFWMYIDEFHHFATPSMAAILSGARKYRLGLVLAHQELHQLESRSPEVASAVLSNAGTRVCFRLGDADAKKLDSGFAHFEADDLLNLGTGEAIGRFERSDADFNFRTSPLVKVDESVVGPIRDRIVAHSRETYATPREAVEQHLRRAIERRDAEEPPVSEKPQSKPKPSKAEPPSTPPPQPPEPPEPIVESNEAEPEAPPEPTPVKPRKPRPDLLPEGAGLPGKGGPQHKYLQQLIKQWGDGMGFRSEIEKSILAGEGSVDVSLEKPGRAIACLISVTTGGEWELNSVRKCLTAGYGHIVIVSPDGKHLAKLEKSITSELTESQLAQVHFLPPEDCFAFIQELEVKELQSEKTVRGYKVKTSFTPLNLADGQTQRQAIAKVVAGAIHRNDKKKASKRSAKPK